jgi:hypothetical protein
MKPSINIDVTVTHGPNMPEILVIDVLTFLFELRDDLLEIDGVPKNNGVG